MDCDACCYNDYDEDLGESVCTADLDEDEYVRLMAERKNCPFFSRRDEYGVVRHQN